jgi:hypothetical protein
LDDKGSDAVIVGDNVEFTLTVKKNKQNKDYNLLTLKKVQQGTPTSTPQTLPGPPRPAPHVGGGITALDVFHAKLEMNKSIFEAVLQQLADGKFDDARASEKMEFYRNYFENVIDVLARAK